MAKTAKKTARKAARRKPGKGKRYSDSAKQQIIAFVEEVNAAKGRGGVAAAARKYGVSPLSISNWIRKGVGGGGGGSAPARGRRRKSASGTGREGVLSDLTDLNRDIAKKRGELEKLEERFESLKASL